MGFCKSEFIKAREGELLQPLFEECGVFLASRFKDFASGHGAVRIDFDLRHHFPEFGQVKAALQNRRHRFSIAGAIERSLNPGLDFNDRRQRDRKIRWLRRFCGSCNRLQVFGDLLQEFVVDPASRCSRRRRVFFPGSRILSLFFRRCWQKRFFF